MKQISITKIRKFFLFQIDDFSAMQGVMLVSQRMVLLEENFLCPPIRRPEWDFPMNLPSPSRETLLVKEGYQCPVQRQRLHPADYFPSRIQQRRAQTLDTRLCPYLVHLHLKEFRPSFHVFLAG